MDSNETKAYVGIHKGPNYINWETVRPSPKEVWDAIFYNVEKAASQFSREQAPAAFHNNWDVVEVTVTLPPRYTGF